MKKSIFLLVVIASFLSMGSAHASGADTEALPEEVNLREPPFWMASYDEFKDLQPSQKDFYLEKLGPELRKILALENTTQAKLAEAAEWYKSWNSIEKKLYVACRDKKIEKDCDRIAEVRLAALSLSSNATEVTPKAESLKSEKKTK